MSLLTSSTDLVLNLVVFFGVGSCQEYAIQKRVCKRWSTIVDKHCDWEAICNGFEEQRAMTKFMPRLTCRGDARQEWCLRAKAIAACQRDLAYTPPPDCRIKRNATGSSSREEVVKAVSLRLEAMLFGRFCIWEFTRFEDEDEDRVFFQNGFHQDFYNVMLPLSVLHADQAGNKSEQAGEEHVWEARFPGYGKNALPTTNNHKQVNMLYQQLIIHKISNEHILMIRATASRCVLDSGWHRLCR